MAVAPPLPNLAPKDMRWFRWATAELAKHTSSQQVLSSNVAAAQQTASSAHTATAAVVAKTAAQEAVNPSMPVGPPQIPSVPTLSTDHGTVTIMWDGFVLGNTSYTPQDGDDIGGSATEPAIGFNHVSAYRGDTADGPWINIGGAIRKIGTLVDVDVTVGQTYWYRLVTTDNAQVESPPGAAASVLVKGVDLGTLDKDVTDALAAAATAAQAGIDAAAAGQAAADAAAAAASTADSHAAGALQAANLAQQAADNAYTQAEVATNTSNIAFSNVAPTGDVHLLWINTTNNANTPMRWNGTAWVVITDKAAIDAANAAAAANTAAGAAQTTANQAVTAAQGAQNTANNALTTANGKNKVYYQPASPPTTGNTVNDLWFDTDDGYKLYVWTGTTWSGAPLGSSALATNSVTASQLASGAVDGTKLATAVNTSISAAQTTANTAVTNAATAQTAANNANTAALGASGLAAGKSTVVYATSAPTGDATVLWINTTNNANTPNRWNGTAWVAVTDKVATDAANAAAAANTAAGNAQSTANTALANAAAAQTTANTAQTSANGKTKVTYSTGAASGTGTTVGDMWFTQDASGAVTAQYLWTGSAWLQQTLTSSVIANLDAGKITAGTLAAARIGANSISANQMIAGTITAASGIIADAAITSAKISALDAGKITTGILSADRIAGNSITAAKMVAGTINAASGIIANGTIGNAQIADAAVNNAKIANLAVNDANINDLNGNKIQAGTIVAGKLSADAVTTNNIVAGAIDTNRIAAGAITADKLTIGTMGTSTPVERVPAALTNKPFWDVAIGTSNVFHGKSQGSQSGCYVANDFTGLVINNGSYCFFTPEAPVPASGKVFLSGVNTGGSNFFVRQFWTVTDPNNYTDTQVNASAAGQTFTFDPASYSYYVYANAANGAGYTVWSWAHVTESIGSNRTGQSAQLSPAGLQLFDVNGGLALDLTTNAAQYIRVNDSTSGDTRTVAAIDSGGNAAFAEVSATAGVDIQGVPLTDLSSPTSLINSTPNGGSWSVGMLDRAPRGAVYESRWDSLDNFQSSAQYIRIAQDQFTLEDGRSYMIMPSLDGLQLDATAVGDPRNTSNPLPLGVNCYIEMQLNTVPNVWIRGGATIGRAVVFNNTRGYFSIPPIFVSATTNITRDAFAANSTAPTADDAALAWLERGLVPANTPIYWQVNFNMTTKPDRPLLVNEGGARRGLTVIDMGSSNLVHPVGYDWLPSSTDRTTEVNGSSSGSSGSTTGGSPSSSRTVTLDASWSRSFTNGGTAIVSGNGQYTNSSKLYQGHGQADMGSQFGFDAGQMGAFAGKTITAMQVYLKNQYSSQSSGVTARLGLTYENSPPGGMSWSRQGAFDVGFKASESKWVNVPSNLWGSFSTGGARGFTLGLSNVNADYAYFAGANQDFSPRLKVTYH